MAPPAVFTANPFDWTLFLQHVPAPPPQLFAAVAAELAFAALTNRQEVEREGVEPLAFTLEFTAFRPGRRHTRGSPARRCACSSI